MYTTYRYAPRSCWYKLIMLIFVILCFVMNILDIMRVVIEGEKESIYTKIWGYFQFSIVPFGVILILICLQYYARLRRYIKGESMIAQTIILDDFRTKMVIEYKRACKLLICMIAWFIVWIIGLISMSINEIDEDYLESAWFWILYLAMNILNMMGFCYYLWVRYDPVQEDDFLRSSQEMMNDNASNGSYNNMFIASRNIDGIEVRM